MSDHTKNGKAGSPKIDKMNIMGLQAGGAYIRHLREQKGLIQAELARRTDTSSSQINRIEAGQGETRATLLAAIIKELNGNANDMVDLLLDKSATPDSGHRMAALWLDRQQQEALSYDQSSVHPEVQSLLMRLTDFELGKWVAFGERLIQERKG